MSCFEGTDLAIEVDADVCAHVLRADLQDAVLVDAARVRPLGDDVVDDALAQVLRHRVLHHRGGWMDAHESRFLMRVMTRMRFLLRHAGTTGLQKKPVG